MIEQLNSVLDLAVGLVWNWPVVILCLGAGVFLTYRLRCVQLRGFLHSLRVISGEYDRRDAPGHISHLQALLAAVSGTVGLGNIAGVAIAVSTGGPGSIFWMWMIGILGMATKYAECGLGTYYRTADSGGSLRGGPMHYMRRGLPERFPRLAWIAGPLAIFFALSCAIASLGAGNMFQSRNVADILNQYYHIPTVVTGAVLAGLVAAVVLGGIKRIGRVAGFLVPFMCGMYVLGAVVICVMNAHRVPAAIGIILSDAFTAQAVAGGAFGTVIITGVRRAVFSSEAGLGSAPIAHAAAQTDVPIRQGIVALLEPFIDTVVVCSATGIIIVLSGYYGPNVETEGVALSARAFGDFIPGFGRYFLPIAASLFALSSAISWSYYGETASEHLFGARVVIPFRLLFVTAVFVGAIWELGPVIAFSDLTLGLMVVPNVFAVLMLSGKVRELTEDYFRRLNDGEFDAPT